MRGYDRHIEITVDPGDLLLGFRSCENQTVATTSLSIAPQVLFLTFGPAKSPPYTHPPQVRALFQAQGKRVNEVLVPLEPSALSEQQLWFVHESHHAD